MGDGSEGVDEGGSDCAGTDDGVKGGGKDGVVLQDQYLGSDRCNAEGSGGVPP